MKKKELSRLYYINAQIERDKEVLARIEARLNPSTANFFRSSHGTTPSRSLVDELTPIIAKLKATIEDREIEYAKEKLNIETYINSIDDYMIRLIVSMKYVDHKSWKQIASRIGGGNTPDSVRQAMNRYLEKH